MSQRDFGNILSGACQLIVGEVDLGHTYGETRLSVTPILREQFADQLGATVCDWIHVGTTVELSVCLGEWTLETLQYIYPLGVADGRTLGIGKPTGARLGAYAQPLTLHPLSLASDDTSLDICFWQAVATGAMDVTLNPAAERLVSVTFRMLPDLTRDAAEAFGVLGVL